MLFRSIQNHVGVAIPKSSIDSFEPLSIESHVLRDNILEMIDILKDSKGQLTNVWKLGNVKRTHVNRFKELVKDSYKALAVVAPTFMAVSTVKDNLEVLNPPSHAQCQCAFGWRGLIRGMRDGGTLLKVPET